MRAMFNWYSAPTLAAMLLFWLLAAYLVTRSPRSLVSLTAVGAEIATGVYLLGQGLAANATNVDEWYPWTRAGQAGAEIAPLLWYWLTVLLVRELPASAARVMAQRLGIALGALLSLLTIFDLIATYAGNGLIAWDQAHLSPAPTYSLWVLPFGPLFGLFAGLLFATTLGGAAFVALGWRLAPDAERRQRFGWLFLSAVLFIVGANGLGFVNYLRPDTVPTWAGHIVIAAAMVVMAWNVAAYSLLFRGQVVRTDFLYFVTATAATLLLYGVLFRFIAPSIIGFTLIELAVATFSVVVFSHALIDVSRRALDRLFFSGDVQRLRANLADVAQSAARTQDLGGLLTEAQEEIAQVSAEHMIRLTEQALRRLNSPPALAESELTLRLSYTVAAGLNGTASPTALEQARALREAIVAAIERLKPDEAVAAGSPGALQYTILREEYLQGLLNKQIMARHALSEGTFARNRRQAIAGLARELQEQEQRLVTTPRAISGTF
ncbi:MAG: hypothetical protein QOF51_2606 [Chloroflexota bacterium]|jgi:hypothetical protein|nr:hypothetical protein [Chloroflexota bacterium]